MNILAVRDRERVGQKKLVNVISDKAAVEFRDKEAAIRFIAEHFANYLRILSVLIKNA
ncbi:MAG: hypothetical protein HQM09_04310 [Candidatus Riflebacteria bacterium]|nr:hypothetical protein [Candidatus Riflebacteria bacterium]